MNKLQEIELLRPLIDELLELSALPIQNERKKLWADHQALRKTDKIPVTCWGEWMPESQWELILGENHRQTESPLAQSIEYNLKRRIWIANNVPDDHIVWPTMTIGAVISRTCDWGVPFQERLISTTGSVGDADHIDPPVVFPNGIEINNLNFTDMEIDEQATQLIAEQAGELVGDQLKINIDYPNLGYSMFDLADAMRGSEAIMFDVFDCPDKVHQLMEFITTSYEQHHLNRQQRGWISCFVEGTWMDVGFRVNCAYVAEDYDPEKPRLCDEWAYVSAQNSCGLGPDMFAEFVQPYNTRLAKYFEKQTVYYHGCERLDHKLDSIKTLPNLRRLHVSPWSSVQAAREKFQGSVVLEVHSHPGQVLLCMKYQEMKAEIKGLVAAAEGVPMDLNLADIETINNNPKLLTMWAQAAQEISENLN